MHWVWRVVISLAVAAASGAGAFVLVALCRRTARRLDTVPLLRAVRSGGAAGLSWLAARVTARLLVLIAGTAVAFALAVIFVQVLGAVVENDDLAAVDRPAVASVSAWRPGWLSPFVVSVTDLGGKLPMTLAVAGTALLAAYRARSARPPLLAACALGGCAVLVAATKVTIGRDRPDPSHHALAESGFAFPSGHSATALVGWALIAWLVRDLTASRTVRAAAWVAAGLLTVAVGLSRIALGVHYPSDVVGGWALGGVWFTTVLIAWRLDTGRRPGEAVLVRGVAAALSMGAIAVLAASVGVAGTLAVTGRPVVPAADDRGAVGASARDGTPPGSGDPRISSAQARRIAVAHAGDGTPTEADLEWERGGLVWSVDVVRRSVEYDVRIDARTGTVLSYRLDD